MGFAGAGDPRAAHVNTALAKSNGATGIAPGHRAATLRGAAGAGKPGGRRRRRDARRRGRAGNVPACTVRGARVLNICQLYEQGPVVLALFVDDGLLPGCPQRHAGARALLPARCASRPSRSKANAASCGELVRARRLTLPVGIDQRRGAGGAVQSVELPADDFAYPGGVVQSKALLSRPSLAASARARAASWWRRRARAGGGRIRGA